MPDPLRPLRINALELMRQPGATRDIADSIEAAPLGVEHDRLTSDIQVDLNLEALTDGIKVTGTLQAHWSTVCRRCLADISGCAVAEVSEVYQRDMVDPEAFAIEQNQLNLAPMVREAILLELDLERSCREDCAGLCPACGVDRNEATCSCDITVRDNRWAALEGFVIDE